MDSNSHSVNVPDGAPSEPETDRSPPPRRRRGLASVLGPGLLTGAADTDPSNVATYSSVGAQFGYRLTWTVPFCVPLMICVQEMCGRSALVTGKGLATLIKERFPKWVLVGSVVLLVIANVINIYADLNVVAASVQMLLHGSFALWLSLFSLGIAFSLVLIPYRRYERMLKWTCFALLAYVIVGLLPSVHKDWHEIGRNMLPRSWSWNASFLLIVVSTLGTSVSPYLFFWQAGEEVEQEVAEGEALRPGARVRQVTPGKIKDARADTAFGMIGSQVVTFFIMVCAAATLNAKGITNVDTAQEAARALLPIGKPAYVLFTVGIVGSGLLAIPAMAGSAAYAVAEMFGWRYGLYRRFGRARGFYLTILAMVGAGFALNFVQSLSPIKALVYAAALNAIVSPPLIALLILICNSRTIMGEFRNGRAANIVGWITVTLMTVASVLLIWALVSSH